MWWNRNQVLIVVMLGWCLTGLAEEGPLDKAKEQPSEFRGTVRQMIEDNQKRLTQRTQRPQASTQAVTSLTQQKSVTVPLGSEAATMGSGQGQKEPDNTAQGVLSDQLEELSSLGFAVPSLEDKMYLVGYFAVGDVAAAEIYYKQVVGTFKPGDLLPNGDKLAVITPYHAFVQSMKGGQQSVTQLYLTSVAQIVEERQRSLDERDKAISQAQELRMFQSSMRGPAP